MNDRAEDFFSYAYQVCGGIVAKLLEAVGKSRAAGVAALLALTAVTYLPGVINLPPVDRTEAVFAETTDEMIERGDFIDARYGEVRHKFRPIGTYWLQMIPASVVGWMSGPGAEDDITPYRLPSMLGVMLAVVATFWLLGPLIGNGRAFVAAALVAVAPIVAVEAHLAIADGIVLPASVIAMLTMLRIYCAREEGHTSGLALAFWIAVGFGVTVNALAVPILVIAALLALLVFDRDLRWLGRLHLMWGLPLAVLLASPWLLVRWSVDGGLFAGMPAKELLELLGGSQDMKWKAAPGTFTLAAVLGFLPGAVLLIPALRALWQGRGAKLQRFLLAWILGYLVYLELISSKPAIYTVQAFFPALGAAVAMAIAPDGTLRALPQPSRGAPAFVIALLMIGIIGGLWWLTHAPVSVIALAVAAFVVIALTMGTASQNKALAAPWFGWSVAGFAGLIVFLFGVLLPSAERIWPSTAIERAVEPLEACVKGPVRVLGFREPSTIFELEVAAGSESVEAAVSQLKDNKPGFIAVEGRWNERFSQAMTRAGVKIPQPVACVDAFNVMRGCPVAFTIYAPATANACKTAVRFACGTNPNVTPPPPGRCD